MDKLFDVPNLDGMTETELSRARDVFYALHEYAATKRSAMFQRARGNIDRALQLEDAADAAYDSLPEWARW